MIFINSGVTKEYAKKPYTIVGMPANTSIIGLSVLRILSDANSLKNMAAVNPTGIATNMAISEVKTVPLIRGNMPNEGLFALSGASFVLKNSANDTSLKNLMLSVIKISMMPAVVKIEMDAVSKKNNGMI
jgi:hypothetical protein